MELQIEKYREEMYEFSYKAEGEKYTKSALFHISDIQRLKNRHYDAIVDINHMIKRDGNCLQFFYAEKFLYEMRLDVDHLTEFLLSDLFKKKMVVKVNPESFSRRLRAKSPVNLNIVEIINVISKYATDKRTIKQIIHIFHNAARIGHYKNLKELVLQHIYDAHIWPDGYGNDELSLYFDGRYTGGCGYNGGIIFHGKHDGFGSGSAPTFAVTVEPTSGYSIHT